VSAAEIYGVVFQNATAAFLARVLDYDGQPVTPSQIASVEYTVAEHLDDMTETTPIDGHTAVALNPSDVLFATLQKGGLWDVDDVGYNFRHVMTSRRPRPFPQRGPITESHIA